MHACEFNSFKYLKMKISIIFLLILFLYHFRWLTAVFRKADFKLRDFSYLNITYLDVAFVDDYMECSFACLQNTLCVSINVAVSPDGDGNIRCELLASTSYNNTAKLTVDRQYHLFEMKVKPQIFHAIRPGIASRVFAFSCFNYFSTKRTKIFSILATEF